MSEKLLYITSILLLYAGLSHAQSDAPYKGGNGDGYAMAELLLNTSPTAITDGLASSLEVYPVPVKKSQDLMVQFGAPGALNSIRLFNLKGTLLLEWKENSHFKNLKVVKIPTQNFPAGIYFLQAENMKESITKKIIIL